jgi:hypothetical protein
MRVLMCRLWLVGVLWVSMAYGATPPGLVEEDILAAPKPFGTLHANEPSDVSMALDSNGAPHIVFMVPRGNAPSRTRGIYHGVRTAQGWVVERLDSVPPDPTGPDSSIGYGSLCRIAFDGLGRAHVVYANLGFHPPGVNALWRQILYRRQTAAGIGVPWTTAQQTYPLVGFVSLGSEMSLAVNLTGDRAYLVTSAGGSAPPVIYQEHVRGSWSPPFAPAFPCSSSRPNVTLTPSGNVWVSCNTGISTGDVIVARRAGTGWDVQFAADAQTNTNPDARVLPLGPQDDLQMCFEGPNDVLAFSSRVSGVWRPALTGNPPGPIIPTLGRLRLAAAPDGWPAWVLTSRGTRGHVNGALLSVSSVTNTGWSTFEVTNTVGVDGMAWVAVSDCNRVHVVYQVLDTTATGTIGMRLRYAAFDAPLPPTLAVPPEPRPSGLAMMVSPSCVRSGEPIALRLTAPSGAHVELAIYDVEGRRLGARKIERTAAGTASLTWDLGHLSSGVYLVQMSSGQESISQRLVVLR